MNYYQFNAEDLAADDSFKEWIVSPTPESNAFWQAFLSDYPECFYQVEEAKRLIKGLDQIQQRVPDTNRVDALWSRIDDSIGSRRSALKKRWHPYTIAWAIAASLILILGAGWFGRATLTHTEFALQSLTVPANDWVETLNEASQVLHIQLADGSQVTLHKGGRLRYRNKFMGNQREVYLVGDAFFNVTKNPQKPFVVYANGLVTKVLGTSFRISAPAGAPTVLVGVKSGRVAVYPNQSAKEDDPELSGIVLTPNQQVVFHRDEAKLDKSLVQNPEIVLPSRETQQFVFDDAPAASVFQAIEKMYAVKVIFDEDAMQHCSVTVSLDRESLFQKLDVICKVLDAEYKLIDAQIVIYSKGCPTPEKSVRQPIKPATG